MNRLKTNNANRDVEFLLCVGLKKFAPSDYGLFQGYFNEQNGDIPLGTDWVSEQMSQRVAHLR